MKKIQICSQFDKLRDYKLQTNKEYGCTFHEVNINSNLHLGQGTFNNDNYHESIITNGKIKINDINREKSFVVFNNNLITLNNGLSVSVSISDATFFVLKTFMNGDIDYTIYTKEEKEELLNSIIDYIYNDCNQLFNTESISIPDTKTIIEEKKYNGMHSKNIITVDDNCKTQKVNSLFYKSIKR